MSSAQYAKTVAFKLISTNHLLKLASPIIAVALAKNNANIIDMAYGVGVAFLIDMIASIIVSLKNNNFSAKLMLQGAAIKGLAYGSLMYLGELSKIYTDGAELGLVAQGSVCSYLFMIEFKSIVKKFIAAGVTELEESIPVSDAPSNGPSDANNNIEPPAQEDNNPVG